MPTCKSEDLNALRSNSLIIMVEQGRTVEMRTFLEAGANPDTQDECGNPVLLLAARRGNVEAVRILLNARAETDACDRHDLTPLYWAAYDDHLEVVELLLNAGGSPRVKDRDGRTPLHWLSYNRGSEHWICRALLKAGADSSIPDNAGWRPKHRPRGNPYRSDRNA